MQEHTTQLTRLIKQHHFDALPTANGCEVGVWKGENSAALLAAFPNLFLYMIDRYQVLSEDESRVTRRLGTKTQEDMMAARDHATSITWPYKERRRLVVGDSCDVARRLGPQMFDFIFIDGHHSYEAVTNDLNAYFDKLKYGGLFCGHDYDGRGDRSGRFGVKKAVDEFATKNGYVVKVLPGHVWWFIK